MGKLFKGVWDCPQCSRKGISKDIRECPGCHCPIDENVHFYEPAEKEYLSEDEASKVSKDPNMICSFCKRQLFEDDSTCPSCGALKTDSELNYFQNLEKQKQKENDSVVTPPPRITYPNPSNNRTTSNTSTSTSTVTTSTNNTSNSDYAPSVIDFISQFWKGIVGIIFGISIIVLAIVLLSPKTEELTISSFSWERSISIEKNVLVDESGWSLPSDATELKYTREEVYKYEQVLDHYETRSKKIQKKRIVGYEEVVVGTKDLGNGYFEEQTSQKPIYEKYTETSYYEEPVYRSDPIYKTKYYYTIYRWKFDHSLSSFGNNQSPYWSDTSNLPDDERISSRKEAYYILGKNSKDELEKIKISFSSWEKLQVGQTVKVKVFIDKSGEIIE